MALKFPPYKHPGSGYHYVRCQVCDRKIFAKDAIYISDKWNTLFGMLVCKRDADKTNPQSIPYYPRPEEPLIAPYVTGDSPTDFVVNPNDDQVPSAPMIISAQWDTLANGLTLFWLGPQKTGSSGIIGYRIQKANPQFSFDFVIEDNTNEVATTYTDTDLDVTDFVSYRVAAINSFGVGPYSEYFYWPSVKVEYENVQFIITSDTMLVIETGDGDLLIM